MKTLKKGDILFHYNSTRGAVLGISRVIEIGQHKGSAPEIANVIQGTQCIQYSGKHLSEDDLTLKQKERNERYLSYLEVHTVQLRKGNMGKLLAHTPQVYLLRISDKEAQRFIQAQGIRHEDLK